MKDVGEFDKRNDEFFQKFNRDKIIKSCVLSDHPVIFDVGAHHGQSIEYLRGLFEHSKIFSFEPDPESFGVLSKKVLDGLRVFNLAISDVIGTVKFYRNNISHTNSLYKVNLDSVDSICFAQERATGSSIHKENFNLNIEVEAITLDKFVSDNSIDNIDLLKIDVQGAEEKVLLGGAGCALQKVNAIIIEISFYDYYEKSTSFIDVERYLKPAGFELFSVLDISRNPMNGRTDWAEVLYKMVR